MTDLRTIESIPTLSVIENRNVLIEIEMLLKEARRWCRDVQDLDTTSVLTSANSPYYCEAFGIIRGLRLMGHGDFGAVNTNYGHDTVSFNLTRWFGDISYNVAVEDGYIR